MKIFLIIISASLVLLDKSTDCTTRIIVTDCDNSPVASATVIIQTCKDSKNHAVSTNLNGIASFNICKTDICKITVGYTGYAQREITKVSDCCNGENDVVCHIKLCTD